MFFLGAVLFCFCFHLEMAFVLLSTEDPYVEKNNSSIIRVSQMAMSSCKEEQTEHAKEMLLEALNIRCAPDVDHEDMSMVRDYIREGLNNLLNMTSVLPIKGKNKTEQLHENNTENDEMQRIQEGLHCCQIMADVSITDLGWTSWIIYPEKFTYAKCVTCEDLKGGTTKKCKVYGKQYSSKISCCTSVTAWIPFIYVNDNYSLGITTVPIPKQCGCVKHEEAD
ncbi:uncharacterized protein LOC120539177 [Polypterus senegalus]|uniref:uncharacterized protein LOC120539177 n=1 Tax=Polypterus senegalus TaxID=55291 RepID=UPI0019631F24|nr:uncharacterized protein LOC120539177 [Polypterus senegalus]